MWVKTKEFCLNQLESLTFCENKFELLMSWTNSCKSVRYNIHCAMVFQYNPFKLASKIPTIFPNIVIVISTSKRIRPKFASAIIIEEYRRCTQSFKPSALYDWGIGKHGSAPNVQATELILTSSSALHCPLHQSFPVPLKQFDAVTQTYKV